jgi:hypothetical protein
MGGMSANPYAAPAARVADVAANPEAEATRRAHISHEASVKAVGLLYYLGGAGLLLTAVAFLFAPRDSLTPLVMALVIAVLGIGQLAAGWGVRALRPWARIVGIVLSVIGLAGFPVGTIVSLYILYLLLSKKGRTIFAPDYQDVIAATPEVKYRTSIIAWIFLALLVALVAFAMYGAFAGR